MINSTKQRKRKKTKRRKLAWKRSSTSHSLVPKLRIDEIIELGDRIKVLGVDDSESRKKKKKKDRP